VTLERSQLTVANHRISPNRRAIHDVSEKSGCPQPFVRNRPSGAALPVKLGDLPMPSAAYFRRQADICLRLSLIASDDAISTRLVTMAKEYLATSEALEKASGTGVSYRVAGAPPEGEGDHGAPDFDLLIDAPGRSADR
jgi:hypothetical protein